MKPNITTSSSVHSIIPPPLHIHKHTLPRKRLIQNSHSSSFQQKSSTSNASLSHSEDSSDSSENDVSAQRVIYKSIPKRIRKYAKKMCIPKEEIVLAFKLANRKIHDTIHPNLNDELTGPLLDFRNLSEVTPLNGPWNNLEVLLYGLVIANSNTRIGAETAMRKYSRRKRKSITNNYKEMAAKFGFI